MPTTPTSDRELAETGVEMIAPHRLSRKNVTQDGRSLRRPTHEPNLTMRNSGPSAREC